jgi:hypothetical protein
MFFVGTEAVKISSSRMWIFGVEERIVPVIIWLRGAQDLETA